MNEFRDINLFKEGTIVDISDIADFQGVKIERVADSGVSISGNGIRECVVSGRSPARLAEQKIKQTPIKLMENNTETVEAKSDTNVDVAVKAAATLPARGKYASILAAMKVPGGDTFTIKQLADENGLPIPYAVKWVNDNCDEAGLAEKPAGQRGRVAKLFKVKG